MAQPSDELIIQISEAVSEALDRPVTDLPPLMDAIDLTALGAIVSTHPSQDVSVSFSYADLRVVVRSDYTIFVYPLRETQPNLDAKG